METLILTGEEIKSRLSMSEVIGAVEQSFREKGLGRVQMPAKIYLFYSKYNGDLRAMPSYLESLDISAVKVVNVHPDNPLKYRLPTVMATIILIDPKNGYPLAIMDGTLITDMRTGAAGGIAAKYLARKDSKIIGMVGAGKQAETQLEALLSLYKKLEEVRVYSRSKERREAFVKKFNSSEIGEIIPVENVEEAVKNTDIIVTTTPSREPLVKDEWISMGTHFNCIGADAPGKQELEPKVLKRAKIVVDDWEQASHSGEINVPLAKGMISKEDIYGEIGEIVAGLKKGRIYDSEVTVFTSTGLAIQDAVTANLVYKKALDKGLGRFIKLIKE
ncbi:MAG: alanine dehydrogenase [Nitrososphaerales archaeon]